MAKKLSSHFIKLSNDFISSLATKIKYRKREQDFTRNRLLSFEQLVLCMLKLLRHSLEIELDAFFNDLQGSMKRSIKKITSSAFIQGRKKLKPDLFFDLNHLIATDYYKDNDEKVKLYKGLRVLSIDGSTIQLPLSDDLKKTYGTFNNQNKSDDMVVARVSVLYDVLNEIVLDGKIRPFAEGEVSLSQKHFQYAQKGDLIIMDRAYASFHSAWMMQQQGIEFIFRCKHHFSNQVKLFYESGKKEAIIEINPKQNTSFKDLPYKADSCIKVRMIRIKLPSGEIEILMTSLIDTEKYRQEEFKALYFKRWKVETFYDRFKNIIGVENFSGTSDQFIQQEFNCALYISNMQTILIEEAQTEAEIKYENREYDYKINNSLSLGFIRARLVKLFSQDLESERMLNELKELLLVNVVPIRPGRSNIRVIDKYRNRKRPKQFKNRRVVI